MLGNLSPNETGRGSEVGKECVAVRIVPQINLILGNLFQKIMSGIFKYYQVKMPIQVNVI